MKKISIISAAFALTLMSGAAFAQNNLDGLVNVNVQDVLNDLALELNVTENNIPVTVQVPVSVAANVCGIDVGVLSSQISTGNNTCVAQTGSQELTQVVQQQMAAGGNATDTTTTNTGTTPTTGGTTTPTTGGTTTPTTGGTTTPTTGGTTTPTTGGTTTPTTGGTTTPTTGGTTTPTTGGTGGTDTATGECAGQQGNSNSNSARACAPGQQPTGGQANAPGQQDGAAKDSAPGQMKKN